MTIRCRSFPKLSISDITEIITGTLLLIIATDSFSIISADTKPKTDKTSSSLISLLKGY